MTNNTESYLQRRRKRAKRPTKLTQNVARVVISVILAVGIITYYSHMSGETPASLNASLATECLTTVDIPDDVDQQIIEYTGFKVNFNRHHHQPNYVAWELTAEETLGSEPRESKFKADNTVEGCASLEDYRRSGYDRGHMAPAGDMKWSSSAMSDSHYLTNVCPQDHSINSGRWSTLENKCRQWAMRDSTLIIICGPILSDVLTKSIGDSKVTVPERFFKVILSPYSIPPRGIGFIMPNHPTEDGIEVMATSIDNIEAITGFDFFQCLPDEIEKEVEASDNYRIWNRNKR